MQLENRVQGFQESSAKVETSQFFSMCKISHLIKIVNNSKYLTDILDGTILFDVWNEHKHDSQGGWLFVLFDW